MNLLCSIARNAGSYIFTVNEVSFDLNVYFRTKLNINLKEA